MNIWDIVIIAVLAAIVALAVGKMVRNKRKGKTACGCDCGSCTCGCGGKKEN